MSAKPTELGNLTTQDNAEMAEWLMAADCKSATHRVTEVRILLSAPPSSFSRKTGFQAGIAQLVERQPSKLNVAGSNPVSRSSKTKPI